MVAPTPGWPQHSCAGSAATVGVQQLVTGTFTFTAVLAPTNFLCQYHDPSCWAADTPTLGSMAGTWASGETCGGNFSAPPWGGTSNGLAGLGGFVSVYSTPTGGLGFVLQVGGACNETLEGGNFQGSAQSWVRGTPITISLGDIYLDVGSVQLRFS